MLIALCLLVALTPLAFAAPLFEPYIATKEVLIQAGTATTLLLWLLTARANSWTLALTPAWITHITTAIQNAPSRLDGQAMLGRLHLERGEDQDALTALNEAMRLGFDVDVYDWKATALEKTGHRAEAIATLNELAWLRPDLQWPRERLSSLKQANEIHEENKR